MIVRLISTHQNWEHHNVTKLMLIDIDDIILSYIDIIQWKEPKENVAHFNIESFYTHEKFRGCGYGRKLFDQAIKLCTSTTCLRVLKGNPVVSLYEHYGFRYDSDDNEYIWMVRKIKN